jgi:hypothetical protein
MTVRQKSKVNWSAGSDLTAFYWRVPECGFEWIRAKRAIHPSAMQRGVRRKTEDAWYLLTKSITPVPHRNYDPLQETGLFRTFADLNPIKQGVCEFADRYGLLGSDPTRDRAPSVRVLRPIGGNQFREDAGETLEAWIAEQHAVRDAVALWDAIKARPDGSYGKAVTPDKYLAGLIQWAGDGAVSYAPVSRTGFQIVSQAQPELFRRFTPGDISLPAQYALQRIVNGKLEEHASTAKLLWDWGRRNPDLRFQVVPMSLIGAVWLQLALAVDGDKNYRRCESCRKWFELSTDIRGDAKFCKQACRFKAYRGRQQRARELDSAGVPVREIAAELDTEIATVKGWLKK